MGAGFASGQEILQFFGFYGTRGMVGVLLAAGLFTLVGGVILRLGRELAATSYRELVEGVAGPYLGRVFDGAITFFLFGILAAMAAGSGALFREQFGLPGLLGGGLLLAATALTVLLGLHGVIASLSFVAPVLLASVFLVSLQVLRTTPVHTGWARPDLALLPSWWLAALVYAAYNLLLASPILAPLGTAAAPGAIGPGALLGGIGLGAGALAILLTLLAQVPAALEVEVPMVLAAGAVHPAARVAYGVVLLAEVYTTAVASLYGLVARFVDEAHPARRAAVILTAAAAWAASLIGFARLVRHVYALAGVVGLALFATLLWQAVRQARPIPFG